MSFVILAPFLLYFIVYIVFLFIYFIQINEVKQISSNIMNRALVEGQFSTALQTELIENLCNIGFDESKISIQITPGASGDNSNASYAKRGEKMTLIVTYRNPAIIYYLSFTDEKSKFYISVKLVGMSEKW